ncbi:hypothetical protein OH76DRAFT_476053 [Lentinus brumalis]|uniref:Uncharacterized protein n=1 Tax=Lentinus brumalis TaxID=2498619 RepID=A0A371CI84_9APHY|nr:hypothetical protein OH76DRAFT_476053 [Polyporus brumalis]
MAVDASLPRGDPDSGVAPRTSTCCRHKSLEGASRRSQVETASRDELTSQAAAFDTATHQVRAESESVTTYLFCSSAARRVRRRLATTPSIGHSVPPAIPLSDVSTGSKRGASLLWILARDAVWRAAWLVGSPSMYADLTAYRRAPDSNHAEATATKTAPSGVQRVEGMCRKLGAEGWSRTGDVTTSDTPCSGQNPGECLRPRVLT